MRVTAAQILADCPLVVGFGGWGVLGSELPAAGEHGPSVGYQWIDPIADANKEIWVRITTEPSAGTLLMWPDSSFEYDGPSTTFEAQLAVDAADVGTPQPGMITVGATTHEVAPVAAVAQPTANPISVQQGGQHAIVVGDALAQATAGSTTVSQTHSIALSSATAQPTASVVWLPLPDGFVPRVALGARLSVSVLAARVQATSLSARLQ